MANVQNATGPLQVLWRPEGELLELGLAFRQPIWSLRLQRTPRPILSRREGLLLGIFALVFHGAVIYWLNQSPAPILPIAPPRIPPMTIEFSQPVPPAVQPPPAAPVPPVRDEPPPVVDELAAKPAAKKLAKPKPLHKPVAKALAKPVEQPLPTPPVNAPATAAPAAPAPVTPPSANAGYLKNPAPQYPDLALRRRWEGTVTLKVQVLADGQPGEIQIQKSSGHDPLDAAALAAVKRWTFVPAKQGDVAQAGWVSVPIDFKLK